MPEIYTYSEAVAVLSLVLIIMGIVTSPLLGMFGSIVAVLSGAGGMYAAHLLRPQSMAATADREFLVAAVQAARVDPRLQPRLRRALSDGRLTVAEYRGVQEAVVGLALADARRLGARQA